MEKKLDGGGCIRSLTEEAPHSDFSDDKPFARAYSPEFTIQSDDKHGRGIALFSS
ncbi:hypothetical protein Bca4012_071864 [Brassica carinata]|uniref:Uncharacterized protein n=1 Tax=Brassica oleracea TaxID=3712 RepID=A0A3P6F1S1_BRAOL|nr:unnamed protein product [Brassica oleracea]